MLMNERSRRVGRQGDASVSVMRAPLWFQKHPHSFGISISLIQYFFSNNCPRKTPQRISLFAIWSVWIPLFWEYAGKKKSLWSLRRPLHALTQFKWKFLSVVVVVVFNIHETFLTHHNCCLIKYISCCSYTAPFLARLYEFLSFISVKQFGQRMRSVNPAVLLAQECVKQVLMEASAFSSISQPLFLSSLSFDCFIHNSLRLLKWLFQASFLTRRLHTSAPEGSMTEYTFAFPVSPAEMKIWCLPRGCCCSAHRCEPQLIDFLSIL